MSGIFEPFNTSSKNGVNELTLRRPPMIEQQSTQWYQSAVVDLTRIAAAIQRQEYFDLK
jgi:hypothetical protein